MSITTENITASTVKRKRLLLVDPDREVNDVLEQAVTGDNWEIERAADNETALSLVADGPFDLVVTGQETTGRDDVELLRKIRTIRPHVRMIILSAKSTPDDVIASLREHAFSYFRAP